MKNLSEETNGSEYENDYEIFYNTNSKESQSSIIIDEIEGYTTEDDYCEDGGENFRFGNDLTTLSIISSLPDERIKTAIKYYEEIISQLKRELVDRSSGFKLHVLNTGDNNLRFTANSIFLGEKTYRPIRSNEFFERRRENKKYRLNKKVSKFINSLSLSKDEKGFLTAEWYQILKGE